METIKGYIYILSNPSFEDFVKIGFARDVEARVKQLNQSECTPYAFRIYATYGIEKELGDKEVHKIIDKLNPDLRSKETINGKERKREFYKMTPEAAYEILEAMSELHCTTNNLKIREPTNENIADEQDNRENKEEKVSRLSPFNFSLVNIKPGEKIIFSNCNSEFDGAECEVVDNRHVKYNGKKWTLSSLAYELSNLKRPPQGPTYFKYNGEWLTDLREKYHGKNK